LGRIHKDTDHGFRGKFSSGPQKLEVTLVKKPHSGDQSYALSLGSPGVRQLLHLGDIFDDAHVRSLKNEGL